MWTLGYLEPGVAEGDDQFMTTATAAVDRIEIEDELDIEKLDIEKLRAEVDILDARILATVRERIEITRRAGAVRMEAGLPRVTHSSEMDLLRRFEKHLGRDGVTLGMLLIRLSRRR